ncbi:MAG: hypothetical protein JNK38_01180 [Acidobacteria bacterium]|nr:hypothetical protein [Acidobacteriota bacterium]
METITVFWKGKFDGAAVSINALDFNPAIHRREADGPWPVEETKDDDKADDTGNKKKK